MRISQILINLINNAIKFTQKGYVKIDISKKENDNFIFEIEDTGIIMKEYKTDEAIILIKEMEIKR